VALNIGASSTQLTLLNNSRRNNEGLGRATERLATGLRINRGSDDPAGLIGAEQLRGDLVDISAQTRINSTLQMQTNIQQQGRQIASNVLIEMRGLAVEAANLSASQEQTSAIQTQFDQSLDSLDTLGAISGFSVPAELETLRSGGDNSIEGGNAADAIEVLDEQLATINKASAAAGAYQKYTLDIDQRLAEDKAVVTAQALSLQEDADYAQETSNLIKSKILNEASIKTIALAQRYSVKEPVCCSTRCCRPQLQLSEDLRRQPRCRSPLRGHVGTNPIRQADDSLRGPTQQQPRDDRRAARVASADAVGLWDGGKHGDFALGPFAVAKQHRSPGAARQREQL
jgi:flagellin-like hook-associated protein FlgL